MYLLQLINDILTISKTTHLRDPTTIVDTQDIPMSNVTTVNLTDKQLIIEISSDEDSDGEIARQ